MTNSAQSAAPLDALRQMIIGKWISMALSVTAELGVADVLASGPRSATELARFVGASEDHLYRLLRALTVVGVLAELDGRRFALTEVGELLRSDHPQSLRGYARLMGQDAFWRVWGAFGDAVRTGEAIVERVLGMGPFEYFAAHPDAAAVFNDAMTSASAMESDAIARAYDFSRIETLTDVAGGHGLLLATILAAYPNVRGVLFEMPHALEGARKLFGERKLGGRCEVVTGDFFAGVPPGADAYLLKHIIHDWDDDRALAILANCRKALKRDGRVLVVDMVIPPPGEPHFGKLLDLEMMAMTQHGKERTREEFDVLFRSANLRLTRIVPTDAPVSVVEGVAA